MSLVIRRTAFAALLGFVLFLMLRPVQEVSTSNDKIDHVVVFVVITLVGVWAALRLRWLVPGLAAYAVLTEVLQGTVTTARHGDPRDLVADVVGILLVALLVLVLRRVRRASNGPRPPHA